MLKQIVTMETHIRLAILELVKEDFSGRCEVTQEIKDSSELKIQRMVDSLHAGPSAHRDPAMIRANCQDGIYTEVGTCSISPTGKLNPLEHDKSNPLSYAIDFYTELFGKGIYDLAFECKLIRSQDDIRHLKFNIGNIGGLDLKTFINRGIELTDFLILSAYVKMDGKQIVIPKYAIFSKAFVNYVQPNKTGSDTHLTSCIDLDLMIKDVFAIKIQ